MKKLIFTLFILLIIGCDRINKSSKLEPDPLVVQMFKKYVDAWSKQEYQKITNEIYEVPFSLYLQDSTSIFNTEEEIKSFLKVTFNELEKNNYGYSIRNQWEHYKVDNDLVVVEMNFTRFYKDSTVMGDNQRTASYILRKTNGVFKISGMIPHTNVSN